jgi:hypothetical protein
LKDRLFERSVDECARNRAGGNRRQADGCKNDRGTFIVGKITNDVRCDPCRGNPGAHAEPQAVL